MGTCPARADENSSNEENTHLATHAELSRPPIPEIQVWETLQEEARSWAIAVLARLIVQTTFKNPELEEEES